MDAVRYRFGFFVSALVEDLEEAKSIALEYMEASEARVATPEA